MAISTRETLLPRGIAQGMNRREWEHSGSALYCANVQFKIQMFRKIPDFSFSLILVCCSTTMK